MGTRGTKSLSARKDTWKSGRIFTLNFGGESKNTEPYVSILLPKIDRGELLDRPQACIWRTKMGGNF